MRASSRVSVSSGEPGLGWRTGFSVVAESLSANA